MKQGLMTGLLAAGAILLSAGGFAAGRLTAPPPEGYIDISAASEDTRTLLAMPGALDFLGQAIHVDNGQIKMFDPRAAAAAHDMPPGYPAWPSDLQLSAPSDGMRWIDTKLAGGELPAAAKEKWAIVNLWATWCAPCLAELPDFNALAATLNGKVGVFVINADTTGKDTAEDVVAMFKAKGFTSLAPLYAPEDVRVDVLSAVGLQNAAYPMTVIFAPGGKPFAYVQDSADDWQSGASGWDTPEMLAFLEQLAALPAPPG